MYDADTPAVEELTTVLHVAGLLTGEKQQAADICVQAYRRVAGRSGEIDEARRCRLLYAALMRSWRRSHRTSVERARGPLELHDLRPEAVTATATTSSIGSIIRDGLRALTDGERSIVALHLAADLELADIGRIVRRPTSRIGKDLATSLEFLADATGSRLDQVETRTRSALAPDHRARADAEALLPQLRTVLAADATRPRRSRSALVTGAAVATAAVLVAAFLIGRTGESDQTADAPRYEAPSVELPRTPSGLKLVGFKRVMITVPESWEQATPLCINVFDDAVLYPMDDELPPCIEAAVPGNSVGFGRFDSIEGDLRFQREHRVILGEVLLLSDVIHQNGEFLQYAALKNADVAVAVRATDRSGLAMVLSSIQEVPDSYVVVPNCLKLDPEDASDLLGRTALSGRVFTDSSNAGSGLPQRVVTQTPEVGTLLPLEATVNLGVLPR